MYWAVLGLANDLIWCQAICRGNDYRASTQYICTTAKVYGSHKRGYPMKTTIASRVLQWRINSFIYMYIYIYIIWRLRIGLSFKWFWCPTTCTIFPKHIYFDSEMHGPGKPDLVIHHILPYGHSVFAKFTQLPTMSIESHEIKRSRDATGPAAFC